MSGKFNYTRWDPVLISSQIVAIQCCFYSGLGLVLFILSHLFGFRITLDLIFNHQIVSFVNLLGIGVTLSFLITSSLSSITLYFIVHRAKKCLDFSLTLFLIHCLIVWFYMGQFPFSFSWWLLIIVSITLMCCLGEYVCLKSELKDIPLLISHSGKENLL
ncbi:Protein SYS1 -like protein [Sarcoptes scabiei]|uniref:Protein SYS1 -like protein n=1 Tax=Sarcoptes scabiei TaxID=52283 RepID=A0A834VGJ7_SARSC|nr:Protein SYS1 -like protein [Sarcoptes scabiei]UXI19169.1 cyclophilin B [Sarcoptes scabiei]